MYPSGASQETSQVEHDPFAADREIAEWVIEQGGTVYVRPIDGGLVYDIKGLSDLPEESFYITHIRCGFETDLEDERFSQFKSLAGLISLDIHNTRADTTTLQVLRQIAGLIDLHIPGTDIHTSDLSDFPQLDQLNSLTLGFEQVDDGWRILEKCPNLKRLLVYANSQVDLSDLAHYPQLRKLVLKQDVCASEILDQLQRDNPKLRVIVLNPDHTYSHIHGPDAIVPVVQKLVQSGVSLRANLSTSGGAVALRGDEFSRECFVWGLFQVTYPEGHEFTRQDVEMLDFFDGVLGESGVRAEGMKNADQLVTALSGWRCPFYRLLNSDLTDRGLATLFQNPSLRRLDVSGTHITEAGVKVFKQKQPLVFIKSDFGEFPPVYPTDSNRELSQVETDPFTADREVAEWVLQSGGEVRVVPNKGGMTPILKAVEQLPEQPFYLHTVQLPRDKQFSQEQLSQLSQLQALRLLAAFGPHLNDKNIAYIGRHPRLYMAHLQESPVKASALSHAPLFPSINSLSLIDSQIDDAGEFLAKSRKLRRLVLYDVSEKTLQSFIDSGNLAKSRLKVLSLPYSVRPQDSIVEKLQVAKPGMRVIWKAEGTDTVLLGDDPVADAVGKLIEQGVRFEGNYLNGSPWNSADIDPRAADSPIDVEKMSFPAGYTMTESTLKLMQPIEISAHLTAEEMKQTHLIVDELADIKIGRFYFQGSVLDDAGLMKLAENSAVGSIDVRETRVTREGVERVKKLRPDLVITSDWGEFGITFSTE